MIFRYPGGKTKLLLPIKENLYPLIEKNGGLADVFMGGGSVTVQAAKDFPNITLTVNDKDVCIHSFWKMLQRDNQILMDQFYALLRQEPTIDLFNNLRSNGIPHGLVERAYYAVFFNRTTFSGILTSGPIGGYEQNSKWTVGCRYNAERLIKECDELRDLFRGRLHVLDMDCIDFVKAVKKPAIYLDPPYFVKGKDLYPVFMTEDEHMNLSLLLKNTKDWVLSYDMCPEIDVLYAWANRIPLDARYSIRDKKKKWTAKQEYLILPPTSILQ